MSQASVAASTPSPGMPEHLTADEVAELLRTPKGTLAYWRHAGQGPRSFRVGRRVLYARDDVLEWLEAMKRRSR